MKNSTNSKKCFKSQDAGKKPIQGPGAICCRLGKNYPESSSHIHFEIFDLDYFLPPCQLPKCHDVANREFKASQMFLLENIVQVSLFRSNSLVRKGSSFLYSALE